MGHPKDVREFILFLDKIIDTKKICNNDIFNFNKKNLRFNQN